MQPESLYEVLTDDVDADAPVLVHALTGFMDAGAARQIAVNHLLATYDHRTIASFDIDAIFDYRARRPRLIFDTDHFASVDYPELVLSELHDEEGTGFMVLHGPEPDLAWRAFTAAVVGLVDRFGVRRSIGMNAIPWPSPHTRPVGMSAHASDPALVAGRPTYVGAIEVPGHLGGALEIALGEAGHEAMGFAAHIPHDLTQVEYPKAALAVLREVAVAGDLVFDLGVLEAQAEVSDREISEQVGTNPENVEAVQALEAQYDAMIRGAASALPLADDEGPRDGARLHGEGPLPTGDELAAQLEDFLRTMDEGKPSSD